MTYANGQYRRQLNRAEIVMRKIYSACRFDDSRGQRARVDGI